MFTSEEKGRIDEASRYETGEMGKCRPEHKDNARAFGQGYGAALADAPLSACRYPAGSSLRTYFAAGWFRFRMEMTKSGFPVLYSVIPKMLVLNFLNDQCLP